MSHINLIEGQKIKTKKTQKTALEELLYQAALKSLAMSYSPYSRKKVAAAVLTDGPFIYSGCNIENASYGATICAERTAIFKAISEGKKQIKTLLILTMADPPWPPCGLCRQVLLEFASLKTPVILANPKGKRQRLLLQDLCPHSFTAEQLRA